MRLKWDAEPVCSVFDGVEVLGRDVPPLPPALDSGWVLVSESSTQSCQTTKFFDYIFSPVDNECGPRRRLNQPFVSPIQPFNDRVIPYSEQLLQRDGSFTRFPTTDRGTVDTDNSCKLLTIHVEHVLSDRSDDGWASHAALAGVSKNQTSLQRRPCCRAAFLMRTRF